MPPRHRVAIIADAHFHDPTGDFGGVGWPVGGQRLALRPYAEMRLAGRAVNDSARALCAALERIAGLGIRQVVLAGDVSDDGQAENLARLADVLRDAEARLGLRIHAIPGNHDGYGIAGKHVAQRLATGPAQSRLATSDPDLPDAVVTSAMRCPGWAGAIDALAGLGQRRRADDLHWESPFGLSDQTADRMYLARSPDGTVVHRLPDASCLIEPEPGLWLLLLDATVFEPRNGVADGTRKRAFHDPSDAGWTAVLRIKPFLIDWIADVLARGRAAGKLVLAISHYPVLPPLPGLQRLLPGAALTRRSPDAAVGARLAAAGLRLHFGGHLHIAAQTAGPLVDVSLPSTCAFPPAATVVEGDAEALRLHPLPLGDLPRDPVVTALDRADGAPASADFAAMLAARYHARLIERRLPREVPPAIWAAVQGVQVEDVPLTDLIRDTVMLAEGGALAWPQLSAARLAMLRALADGRAQGPAVPAAPLAAWLADLRQLLDQVLPVAGAPPDGTRLTP